MTSKVLQAKFDQNLAKMLKKQPLYKKGSVRPHWGTKPVVLYKKSICKGHKATLFVEGIGRGILMISAYAFSVPFIFQVKNKEC